MRNFFCNKSSDLVTCNLPELVTCILPEKIFINNYEPKKRLLALHKSHKQSEHMHSATKFNQKLLASRANFRHIGGAEFVIVNICPFHIPFKIRSVALRFVLVRSNFWSTTRKTFCNSLKVSINKTSKRESIGIFRG